MPNQKNADKLLDYGVVAAKQINDIAQTWRIPFMQRISTLTLQVLNAVKVSALSFDLALRCTDDYRARQPIGTYACELSS
jgi:hypothetical protein